MFEHGNNGDLDIRIRPSGHQAIRSSGYPKLARKTSWLAMEPGTFAAVLHSLIKENMTKLVGRARQVILGCFWAVKCQHFSDIRKGFQKCWPGKHCFCRSRSTGNFGRSQRGVLWWKRHQLRAGNWGVARGYAQFWRVSTCNPKFQNMACCGCHCPRIC